MGDNLGAAELATTTAISRAIVKSDDQSEFIAELVADNLINQNGSIPAALLKSGGKLQRDELALRVIMYNYEFRRHSQNRTLYFYKLRGADVFTQFVKDDQTIRDIVTKTYRSLYKISPSAEVNNTIANIINNITTTADMSAGIIKVGDHLYWYPKDGVLKDTLGSCDECYYVLFNSPESKEIPPIEITRDDANSILGYYYDTWDVLNKYEQENIQFDSFYKDLPMDFEFVKTWAEMSLPGAQDRYWDIIMSFVPNFLYRKPKAAYFLLGEARGGKSSYIELLHYIMGRRNTSTVKMSELADSHKNLTITSTIMNAPDEEKEGKLTDEDIANYKTIATHGQLELNVMYSQVPQKVSTDFMMYIPSNAMPDFHGAGAEACLERAKVISFLANLSRFDKHPVSFLGGIVTKPIICQLIGNVFAFAKYFSNHVFWFSPAMDASKKFVAEATNSSKIYADRWKQYFDGYERWNDVWDDYKNWCRANSYQFEEAKSLKMRFNAYSIVGRTNAKAPDGEWRKVYKIAGTKPVMFHDHEVSKFLGTIEDLHDGKLNKDGTRNDGGKSVVDVLDKMKEQELSGSLYDQAKLEAKIAGRDK